MTVTNSSKSPENLTLTITSEFTAGVERVWQIWEDPRQLERWWGPPTWPATFDIFDFTPGGRADYFMTGPDGTRSYGWWVFTAIDGPTSLQLNDGFADQNREPVAEMGQAAMDVSLMADGGTTVMRVRTTFADTEQMQKMLEMGMEEGMTLAMGQIDALLAE